MDGIRQWWAERTSGEKRIVALAGVGWTLMGVLLTVVAVAVVLSLATAGFGGGPAMTVPQVSLGYEFDGDTVTISHDGGDTLRADRVTVVVDGEPRRWSEPDGTISTGDSTTVQGVPDDATVRVVYRTDDGEIVPLGGAARGEGDHPTAGEQPTDPVSKYSVGVAEPSWL